MSFFSRGPAATGTYTLSLHDALPISGGDERERLVAGGGKARSMAEIGDRLGHRARSEEHTSELQSHHDLVCRLLLEKKKKFESLGHISLDDGLRNALYHGRIAEARIE